MAESCVATDAEVCAAAAGQGAEACTGAGDCDHTPEVVGADAVAEGCSTDIGLAADNCVLTPATGTTPGSCAPLDPQAGVTCTYVEPVAEIVAVSESCAATNAEVCAAAAGQGAATCTGAGDCDHTPAVAGVTGVTEACALLNPELDCDTGFTGEQASCKEDIGCEYTPNTGTNCAPKSEEECGASSECNWTPLVTAVPASCTGAATNTVETCPLVQAPDTTRCTLTSSTDFGTTPGSCAPLDPQAGVTCTYVPGTANTAGNAWTTADSCASSSCPAGCTEVAAVAAVPGRCEPVSVSDVIRSTNDILNKLQEFDTVLSELDAKLSTDDSGTDSGVKTISQKIQELLNPQMMSNKNELSTKITEVVAEVNALKSQIGTSDTSVTSELDSLTEIVSALTASVANMDNITESRIKTCSNKTGVNGGTDKYDCSNTEYGLNTNGICGESDCTDEICCTITKDAPPPPSPSPTEEPSEWVTYVIIAVIIGIIIGLGYMLKG